MVEIQPSFHYLSERVFDRGWWSSGKTQLRKPRHCLQSVLLRLIISLYWIPSQTLPSKISPSLNTWTSSNYFTFLAIVAHYMTDDGYCSKIQDSDQGLLHGLLLMPTARSLLFPTDSCRIPEDSWGFLRTPRTQYWVMCQPTFAVLWGYIPEDWRQSWGFSDRISPRIDCMWWVTWPMNMCLNTSCDVMWSRAYLCWSWFHAWHITHLFPFSQPPPQQLRPTPTPTTTMMTTTTTTTTTPTTMITTMTTTTTTATTAMAANGTTTKLLGVPRRRPMTIRGTRRPPSLHRLTTRTCTHGRRLPINGRSATTKGMPRWWPTTMHGTQPPPSPCW